MSGKQHFRNSAFTLVELLVVVAIIGVLIGILLPAVHKAEEAFKKTQCQSNLHQWGVAMSAYCETHSTYPAGCTSDATTSGAFTKSNLISPHLQILPFFEESKLYESVDYTQFQGGTLPPHIVRIFQCPADLIEMEENQAQTKVTSYQVNCGTWVEVNGWDGVFGPNTTETIFGPMGYMPGGLLAPVRMDDITDGAANTAMMSEICSGRMLYGDFCDKDPRGYTFRWTGTRPKKTSLAAARADMLAKSWVATTALNSPHGVEWTKGDPESTWYNHVLPPNSASWMFGNFLNGDMHRQASPATSWHDNGVNVLMVDGSVHFVRDRIDPDVWSALGSRNGGDKADLPD